MHRDQHFCAEGMMLYFQFDFSLTLHFKCLAKNDKRQGLIHAAETEQISYLICCIELRVSLMKEQFTRIHIVFHE